MNDVFGLRSVAERAELRAIGERRIAPRAARAHDVTALDRAEARRLLQSPDTLRLVTRRELQTLFPDARILVEYWAPGLVKSYIAVR